MRGGRGPALYVAGVTLQLRDVRVSGHEYGLLSGGDARVDAKGLRSTGAERAGVALVRTQAVLEQVHVESAGQLAGIQLVSSEVRIRGLEVVGGRSSGLVTRDAQLTLEDATFVGPRAGGLRGWGRDPDPRGPRLAHRPPGPGLQRRRGGSPPRPPP